MAPLHTNCSQNRRRWQISFLIISEVSSEELSASLEDGSEKLISNDREKQRERRLHAIVAGKRTAKMLDLQYFLEVVDQERRYGSILR